MKTQGKTAVIYARFGSRNQLASKSQVGDLIAFAKQQGIEVIEQIVDENSGEVSSPALSNLRQLAIAYPVQFILVSDLTRLSRSPQELDEIVNDLRAYGIEIVAVNRSGKPRSSNLDEGKLCLN